MNTLIEQSFLTGTVQGIPYRALLEAKLTTDAFVIGFISGKVLAHLPIRDIEAVQQIRNIVEFGIRIHHKHHYLGSTIGFRTRRYGAWGRAFEQLGVVVLPPRGWWSDFD